MDQRIINLFDEYTHKPLKRQDFLNRLTKITGSLTAALTALSVLEVNYAHAATVLETDQDITTEDVEYEGDKSTMKAYLARPKSMTKAGGVMVIHENRGLNPHIKDVTRRIAKAGFIAFAPDALSPFGGTPEHEDEARSLFGKLAEENNRNNFLKGLSHLRERKDCNGKTGCVGFCWGGAMVNQLAVHDSALKAAVSFYGRQPDPKEVAKIKAQVQLHYGSLDERINAGIREYEEALKESDVRYELFIYDGAQHAFHNDTSPARYHPEAASRAWQRTIQLFHSALV